MPTLEEIKSWTGHDVTGPDGSKVGKVDQIYLDRQTGEPTFASIKTGLFGTKSSFVPVEGGRLNGDTLEIPFDKDKVKDAPNVEADAELSEAEEQELYAYYGQSHSSYDGPDHENFGTADRDRDRDREPVGHDTSGPTTDDAMTRSEEQLKVGKTSEETGRARLRKYVVTEDVQTTVPVSHEEVRIEREPITDANVGDANDGPAISEEEHEVTLRAERPVVEKEVVAQERVRLEKETVTEDATVDEQVRKERIETDGATGDDVRR